VERFTCCPLHIYFRLIGLKLHLGRWFCRPPHERPLSLSHLVVHVRRLGFSVTAGWVLPDGSPMDTADVVGGIVLNGTCAICDTGPVVGNVHKCVFIGPALDAARTQNAVLFMLARRTLPTSVWQSTSPVVQYIYGSSQVRAEASNPCIVVPSS
jgi:hypothetical protein